MTKFLVGSSPGGLTCGKNPREETGVYFCMWSDSLSSAKAQRGYRHAIDEFVEWYCPEPRLSFNKTVVLRYRIHPESRLLAPGTINLRLGAVRRLAHEAADSGTSERRTRRCLLNECSIGCEEHLTLKRLHVFVHGDTLLHFPLIVLSKISDDRHGEIHPVFRATTRTRQVSCRRNTQRPIGLAIRAEDDATV